MILDTIEVTGLSERYHFSIGYMGSSPNITSPEQQCMFFLRITKGFLSLTQRNN
jgi:hypothetical protein